MLNDKLIISPNPEWYIYRDDTNIKFPNLHYMKCDKIDKPKSLRLGGSYAYFCDYPLYDERCLILEQLYMPYKLNTKNFKIRNGLLLWPHINLRAFTDLEDPNSVYIKKQNPSAKNGDMFIAILRFYETHIELYEYDDTNDNLENNFIENNININIWEKMDE